MLIPHYAGINDTVFYDDLKSEGVPITNRIVNLLLNNVTINTSAILPELWRIQRKDPDFVPLIETFYRDVLEFNVSGQGWRKNRACR